MSDDGVTWSEPKSVQHGRVQIVGDDGKTASDRRISELEKAVADAIDMVLVWGSYADDYSKNKHGFERDLAELRAVLERK